MKVIAINGSPRKKWNTAQMLESFLDGIRQADGTAEIERIDAALRSQMTQLVRLTVTRPADMKERIAALLRSFGPFEEICPTRAGSTISSHCGPKCLGILYYNK